MAHLQGYVDEVEVGQSLAFNSDMDPVAEYTNGAELWYPVSSMIGEIYPDRKLMVWYQDSEMRSYGVSGP